MPLRYLRDPLFLSCVVFYFVNRLLLKPHVHGGVMGTLIHGYVNDLICLPFWVPIMVWMMHKTGLRASDAAPQATEILAPPPLRRLAGRRAERRRFLVPRVRF